MQLERVRIAAFGTWLGTRFRRSKVRAAVAALDLDETAANRIESLTRCDNDADDVGTEASHYIRAGTGGLI